MPTVSRRRRNDTRVGAADPDVIGRSTARAWRYVRFILKSRRPCIRKGRIIRPDRQAQLSVVDHIISATGDCLTSNNLKNYRVSSGGRRSGLRTFRDSRCVRGSAGLRGNLAVAILANVSATVQRTRARSWRVRHFARPTCGATRRHVNASAAATSQPAASSFQAS